MRSINVFIFLLITSLTISSWSASATLIERDYLEWGDGGITYDDSSGREWLDLTFTRTLDFGEYQQFLATANNDGWTFATSLMVGNLFSQFGFSSVHNQDYGNAKSYQDYYYYSPRSQGFSDLVDNLTILGETMSIGTKSDNVKFYGVRGYVDTGIVGDPSQYMAYLNEKIGVVSLGTFKGNTIGSRYESFFTYRDARDEIVFEQPSLPITNQQPIDVSEPTTLGLFTLMLSILAFRRYRA